MSEVKRELNKMDKKWSKSLGSDIDPVTDYWTNEPHCDPNYKAIEIRVVPEKQDDRKALVTYRHCVVEPLASEVLAKQGEVIVRKPKSEKSIKRYYPAFEKTSEVPP